LLRLTVRLLSGAVGGLLATYPSGVIFQLIGEVSTGFDNSTCGTELLGRVFVTSAAISMRLRL